MFSGRCVEAGCVWVSHAPERRVFAGAEASIQTFAVTSAEKGDTFLAIATKSGATGMCDIAGQCLI